MARPREFETGAVLEQATRVFWAKGFENASLDDLCEATGLNRSSLYSAFGDKRKLYLSALARFLTAGIQGLRLVGKANPDRAALEQVAALMLKCLYRR